MKVNKVSILIPIYNEEDSVSETIEQIKKTMVQTNHKYEIIAIDDCSKDNSGKILDQIKNIKVIHHIKNKGYSASLKTGIKAAKGDWIVIIDADGTYPVNEIPNLLRYTDKYDMVVGARKGKHVKIPLFRKPAKWFLNIVASYIAGRKILDLNSGLRAFKKEIALRFWNLFPDGFSFTSTITLACLTNNLDVKYVPIDYRKRKGKSSIKPKHFIMFCNILIRMTTYFKPLKIFLPISVIFLILGISKGTFDFINQGKIGAAAVTTVLAAIQIGFLGLLAELIIKRTNL